MTKNLHTKIILILLLCFTLVLLAFACTPNGVTVVSNDPSGGGSGGSSGSGVDVTGGDKTDIVIGDFFSYLKDAIQTEDADDSVAFDLTTKPTGTIEWE